VLSRKIEIDFLNKAHELKIPDGGYKMIAGYVTSKIRRIPKKGAKNKIDIFNFVILHATKIKINLLKMFVYQENES
jgi:CBS domain containing-hemolysin-like protein